jgi:hypothetical protein
MTVPMGVVNVGNSPSGVTHTPNNF